MSSNFEESEAAVVYACAVVLGVSGGDDASGSASAAVRGQILKRDLSPSTPVGATQRFGVRIRSFTASGRTAQNGVYRCGGPGRH